MTGQCVICDTSNSHRHACDRCITDTRRRLRELELYAAWLNLPTMLTPSRGDTGRRSPGYGSRPPARVDALVMLDRRSTTNPTPIDENRGLGLDDDPEPGWSILGTLAGLAAYVRGHTGHTAPRTIKLVNAIGYLLSQLDWAANHPWVGDLAADIRQLHAQARQLVHDTPNPLGQCLTVVCGGQVYPATLRDTNGRKLDGARCTRCDRPYTGLDLVRLAAQREAS